MKYACSILIILISTLPLAAQQYAIQWADTVDNGSEDFAYGITLDAQGNVYVTGKSTIGANYDYLTIKYDPTGTILWADTFDNGGDDIANAINADVNQCIYVTGQIRIGANFQILTIVYDTLGSIQWIDTLYFSYGGMGYSIGVNGDYGNVAVIGDMDNNSNIDIEILKYSFDLLPIYGRAIDNGGDDHGRGAEIDANDNIYLTGYSYIGSDFDYLTALYDFSGNMVWADTFDNGGNDLAWDIALDSRKNVYVTGQSYNAGADDFLTIKYDSLGTFLWADTPGIGDFAFGVAIDPHFNIYVAGRRYNGSDFDDLVIKYDSTGTIIWADTIDNGSTDYFWDIAVDASENIYVTGHSVIGGDADYFTVKYLCMTGTGEDNESSSSPLRNEILIPSIYRTAAFYTYRTASDADYSLSLYAINGSMVHTTKGCGRGSHVAQLPVLPSGIYFLRLEQNNSSVTVKTTIVR